jgi:site-specific recombinase XerD
VIEHPEGCRRIRADHRAEKPKRLETWTEAYVSLREALGFTTVELRKDLRRLVAFMHENGILSFDRFDRASAARLLHAGDPQEMTIAVRLAGLRGFFRYLVSLDAVEENLWDTFPNLRPKQFIPYIFSFAELRTIFDGLHAKISRPGNTRAHVHAAYYTLFHTLYACGMRTCEACGLDIGDVDFEKSHLMIRNTKFYKSRVVPFNARTAALLRDYLERFRPADDGMAPAAPFFVNSRRRRFRAKNISGHFARVCQGAGVYRVKRIEGKTVLGGTTTHALRHAFAVHRLLKWYEEGADVQSKLPLLATYMGHARYHNTQRYLTVLPALIEIAGKRFATSFETPLKDLE